MRASSRTRALALATFISSSFATTFDILVGFDQLHGRCAGKRMFEPPSIQASPGDEVNFLLKDDNLSITRSEFEHPCTPPSSGNNVSSDFISFPAAGSLKHSIKLVLLEDYDGSPLLFYGGTTTNCSPDSLFAINPPPNHYFQHSTSASDDSSAPPVCSHMPTVPEMLTTPVPLTDITPTPTHMPDIATPVPQEPDVVGTVAGQSDVNDGPLSTSRVTVAILPHTTLVHERVFGRPSSSSQVSQTTLEPLPQPSSQPGGEMTGNSIAEDSDSFAKSTTFSRISGALLVVLSAGPLFLSTV